MRLRCAALLCAMAALSWAAFALFSEVRRTLAKPERPSMHESMRLQMERARAHAPGVANRPGQAERHALARGRDALLELGPGEELLVTTAQLLKILAVSVDASASAHELRLLEVARRMQDLKTQSEHRPLSIVRTNTVPAFIILLQARGEHESFLLHHMRGAGGHAYHSNLHEPIGAVLEHVLSGKCTKPVVVATARGTVANSSTVSRSLMIDGGAYFGFFGLQAAALGCSAVIIEPQRMLAPYLAASVLLNGAGYANRIQIMNGVIAASTTEPHASVPSGNDGGARSGGGGGGSGGSSGKVHLVDRQGMSSYAVAASGSPITSAASTLKTFALDDDDAIAEQLVHDDLQQTIVALKLDVEGFEVAALQGVTQLALQDGKVKNIVLELGPPARWLRAATGVSQPQNPPNAPAQRGSVSDHAEVDAIIGDPAIIESLVAEAISVLQEFAGDGQGTRTYHYEVRWLVNTPGWRPVVAKEFELPRHTLNVVADPEQGQGQKQGQGQARVVVEYAVIPSKLLESVVRRLMSGRRSTEINLWLSLLD